MRFDHARDVKPDSARSARSRSRRTANTRPHEQLRAAAVIFGEPSEAQLAQTENLRLLQLTWAGADKYTRMENLPQSVVLANASGAFGTIIAEVRDWQSGGAVPLVWTVLEQ